jgi:nucleoside-diphosphate-sugar epimerase
MLTIYTLNAFNLHGRRYFSINLQKKETKTIMSILITGASGFLGGHLIQHLLKCNRDDKIVALFRSKNLPSTPVVPDAYQSFIENYGQRFIYELGVDFDDEFSLGSVFAKYENIQTVIHLAFLMEFHPDSKAEEEKQTNVNIRMAKQLLKKVYEYQEKHQRRIHFIFASSQEAMGPVIEYDEVSGEKRPAVETTPCKPTYLYGKNKREVEQMLIDQKNATPSVDYTILRICGVAGRGDRYAVFEMIQAISWGILVCYPGSCHGLGSFVYVNDVVNGIDLCQKKRDLTRNQIFIIGPSSSCTFLECIDICCQELGWSKPFFTCPKPVFKLMISAVYRAYNRVRNIFTKNRHEISFLFHPATIDSMSEDRWYSSEKAQKLLGYSPMSTKETIRLACQEHIKEGAVYHRNTTLKKLGLFILLPFSLVILAWLFIHF